MYIFSLYNILIVLDINVIYSDDATQILQYVQIKDIKYSFQVCKILVYYDIFLDHLQAEPGAQVGVAALVLAQVV